MDERQKAGLRQLRGEHIQTTYLVLFKFFPGPSPSPSTIGIRRQHSVTRERLKETVWHTHGACASA